MTRVTCSEDSIPAPSSLFPLFFVPATQRLGEPWPMFVWGTEKVFLEIGFHGLNNAQWQSLPLGCEFPRQALAGLMGSKDTCCHRAQTPRGVAFCSCFTFQSGCSSPDHFVMTIGVFPHFHPKSCVTCMHFKENEKLDEGRESLRTWKGPVGDMEAV